MSSITSTAKRNRKKLSSIQSLRGIAFIGIFLLHADIKNAWAELGVSVFFVLSGFLLLYKNIDTDYNVTLKNCILFSKSKINKLYFLHIFTMLFFVVKSCFNLINDGFVIDKYLQLFGKVVLNITLLQTWFPKLEVNTSLNGVSWFLSVMAFLYFTFPFIQRYLKKVEKISTLLLIPIAFVLIQIFSCYGFIQIFGSESNTYSWFMYCFPLFRLGDFIT